MQALSLKEIQSKILGQDSFSAGKETGVLREFTDTVIPQFQQMLFISCSSEMQNQSAMYPQLTQLTSGGERVRQGVNGGDRKPAPLLWSICLVTTLRLVLPFFSPTEAKRRSLTLSNAASAHTANKAKVLTEIRAPLIPLTEQETETEQRLWGGGLETMGWMWKRRRELLRYGPALCKSLHSTEQIRRAGCLCRGVNCLRVTRRREHAREGAANDSGKKPESEKSVRASDRVQGK